MRLITKGSIKSKLVRGFVTVIVLYTIVIAVMIVSLNFTVTSFESVVTKLVNGGTLDATAAATLTATVASLDKSRMKLTVIMIIIILVVAALATVIEICIVRNIVYPTRHMIEVANQLALGDCGIEVETSSEDEIGELGVAINKIVANMKSQADMANVLAKGDLSLEVRPSSDKDLLGIAIRNMIAEENKVLTGIRQAVSEVSTGSDQVASASQALAQGSTEQASAIEQISASITDIAEKTRVNASHATETNNLVDNIRREAVAGNERMNDMVDAMTDINESSENISKIIKVIDDIAFQTNILALNAAVEAARAGVHGKGFAVVADEVRNLAQKSAQAADETSQMISDTIEKVEKGTTLVHETAGALGEIVTSIEKCESLTDGIAKASGEQALAISQINQALGQVSTVVQTNSATSQQCAAASEELSAQAVKLREMVGIYKLKDGIRLDNDSRYFTPMIEKVPAEPQAALPAREQHKLPQKSPSSANRPALEDKYEPLHISLDDDFGKY